MMTLMSPSLFPSKRQPQAIELSPTRLRSIPKAVSLRFGEDSFQKQTPIIPSPLNKGFTSAKSSESTLLQQDSPELSSLNFPPRIGFINPADVSAKNAVDLVTYEALTLEPQGLAGKSGILKDTPRKLIAKIEHTVGLPDVKDPDGFHYLGAEQHQHMSQLARRADIPFIAHLTHLGYQKTLPPKQNVSEWQKLMEGKDTTSQAIAQGKLNPATMPYRLIVMEHKPGFDLRAKFQKGELSPKSLIDAYQIINLQQQELLKKTGYILMDRKGANHLGTQTLLDTLKTSGLTYEPSQKSPFHIGRDKVESGLGYSRLRKELNHIDFPNHYTMNTHLIDPKTGKLKTEPSPAMVRTAYQFFLTNVGSTRETSSLHPDIFKGILTPQDKDYLENLADYYGTKQKSTTSKFLKAPLNIPEWVKEEGTIQTVPQYLMALYEKAMPELTHFYVAKEYWRMATIPKESALHEPFQVVKTTLDQVAESNDPHKYIAWLMKLPLPTKPEHNHPDTFYQAHRETLDPMVQEMQQFTNTIQGTQTWASQSQYRP
ncbi:MAG: hypothetical protein ACKO37_08515 [Vampirovibrionales bacterium]